MPGRTGGRHHRPRRRLLTGVRWALALVAVAAGVMALLSPPSTSPDRSPEEVAAPPAPVALTSPVTRTVAAPARVTIPAIGVDSTLTELGVDPAGALVPPADFAQAGWFAAGPAPGEVGPAVLAGHVDDYRGPAVFFRLEELAPGDRVEVTDRDGQALGFTVTRVAEYPKSDFATAEVYGPTTGPELRLITCGGAFDRSRRSYTDNVVVFAVAT
jgi:sortase (surface protein transpeptidase)